MAIIRADSIEYARPVAEQGQSLVCLQPDWKGNLLRIVAEYGAINALTLIEQHLQQEVCSGENDNRRQNNFQKIEKKLHSKGYLSKGGQRYAHHS